MLYDAEDYRIALSMMSPMSISIADRIVTVMDGEKAFFDATPEMLRTVLQLSGRQTTRAYRDGLLHDAVAEHAFTDTSGIRRRYFRDSDYPQRLAVCEDAPAMLYTIGDCNLDDVRPVAIVGTRHATAYGIAFTEKLVEELASAVENIVIVSGLAYGIDVAAHRAALRCGVPTVAVMATPLNTIYPADHRDIAARIVRAGGALVSEYSSNTTVHKGSFLARNRIIAAMSDVTVVVESDLRGGALATARMAAGYSRNVYALPGRVNDKYSRGCNLIIANQTAQLLVSSEDIIEDMCWPRRPSVGTQQTMTLELTSEQQAVVDIIRAEPAYTVNDISTRLNMRIPTLTNVLMQLEMEGIIIRVPGNRFVVI